MKRFDEAVQRIVNTSVDEGILDALNCDDLGVLHEALRREAGSATPRTSLVLAIERRIRRLEKSQ